MSDVTGEPRRGVLLRGRGVRPRRRGWRRVRRWLGLVVLVALVPMVVSYVTTMLHPSNTSPGVRSVEWLRAHGAAWLVSDVENLYYSLHAPSKGGPALRALPAVGLAGGARPGRTTRHRRSPYRPARVRPVIDPALAGEGVWRPAGPAVRGAPPVLVTTFRPDPSYPQLVAGVAWINRSRTSVALYPGRYEPPSAASRGPEQVPAARRRRLVATFNSGFKLEDSHGGFAALGHTDAPLQRGIATLVGYRDGRVDVRAWRGGTSGGPEVASARQNLPLIVDHARANPNLSDGPEWGATLGNAVRVWRSGVGVDRHGDLLYAAANDQTVGSLAAILIRAGAVRAMELDINYEWVSFNTYGGWNARVPAKLLPGMDRPPDRYLSPEDRDFFAVYARRGR